MPSSMRPVSVLLSFALLLAPLIGARAQLARLGDTVRVHHPEETEGVLVGQDATSLQVRPLLRSDTVTIGRHDVASVERLMGTRHRVWTPVLIGTGVGFAFGAIAGYSFGDDPQRGFISFTAGDKALIFGTVLGVSGAVIGGLIALIEVPNWVPVIPTAMSLRPAPVDGRIGLALRWQP